MTKKPLTKKQQAERKRIAADWKTFRTERLFTQVALASLIGITKRQLQNIEAGVSKPGFATESRFRALKAKHQRVAV